MKIKVTMVTDPAVWPLSPFDVHSSNEGYHTGHQILHRHYTNIMTWKLISIIGLISVTISQGTQRESILLIVWNPLIESGGISLTSLNDSWWKWAIRQLTSSTFMMTSSNGSIFLVTGSLLGESTSHRWIPLTKLSDAELWCFIWSAPEQTVWQTMETQVIWNTTLLTVTSL